jgi:hypothetical protein
VLNQSESTRLATRFQVGMLLGLFDPENGGDMFLRNVEFQRTTRSYIPEDSIRLNLK